MMELLVLVWESVGVIFVNVVCNVLLHFDVWAIVCSFESFGAFVEVFWSYYVVIYCYFVCCFGVDVVDEFAVEMFVVAFVKCGCYDLGVVDVCLWLFGIVTKFAYCYWWWEECELRVYVWIGVDFVVLVFEDVVVACVDLVWAGCVLAAALVELIVKECDVLLFYVWE